MTLTRKDIAGMGFIYVALVIIVAVALIAVYWVVWPVRTFEPLANPVRILNADHKVPQGEYIVFEDGGAYFVDNVQVNISAQLEDGFVLQYPVVGLTTVLGRIKTRPTARYIIPCFIPPGQYTLQLQYVFQVNPLRVEHINLRTQTFDVIPSKQCYQELTP